MTLTLLIDHRSYVPASEHINAPLREQWQPCAIVSGETCGDALKKAAERTRYPIETLRVAGMVTLQRA